MTLETTPEGVRTQMLRRSLETSLFGDADPVKLGRFSLLGRLGAGGMGIVYAAYDPDLDRRVAVKVLRAERKAAEGGTDRLLREAKAMAKLSHPNVVTVHEVGVEDGNVFVAMEYVEGRTLSDWGERDGSFEAALAVMRQCAEGLAAAHEAGLVHRDFKPHNVLLTADGLAKIADFGLARVDALAEDVETMDEKIAGRSGSVDDSEQLTRTGDVLGTPQYMAPEQFRGLTDARSDQFSFCATFFEVFFACKAFEGSSMHEVSAKILDGTVSDLPDGHDAPGWLVRLLRRGLEVDPENRFPDMRAVLVELHMHTRRKRGPVLGILALAVLGVGAAAWAGTQRPAVAPVVPCSDGEEEAKAVWGDARQAEVRGVFENTGLPFWEGVWDLADARLDDWSDRWKAAYLDSCEATRIRKVQTEETMELRVVCLEQQRDSVALLSQNFLTLDARTLSSASGATLALPDPARCSERESLIFGDGSVTLKNDDARQVGGAIRRAKILAQMTRDAEAELELLAVLDTAESSPAPSLAASLYAALSSIAYRRGAYPRSAELARISLSYAERSGRTPEAVIAWHRLTTAAIAMGDLDDAEFYNERGFEIAKSARVPLESQIQTVLDRAEIYADRGDPRTASRLRLEAADTLRGLEKYPAHYFHALNDAIGTLLLAGQTEKAREVGREALELAEQLHGPGHPMAILARANIAQVELFGGNVEEALEASSQAYSALPPLPGMRPERWAAIAQLHGSALKEDGQHGKAQRIYRDAIAVVLPVVGDESPAVIDLKSQLAALLLETGDPVGAAAALDELVPYHEQGAVLPYNQGAFFVNLALAHARAGNRAEALRRVEQGMQLVEASTDLLSPWRFESLRYSAEIYELCGKSARARSSYELALEIARTVDVDSEELQKVEDGLARLRG